VGGEEQLSVHDSYADLPELKLELGARRDRLSQAPAEARGRAAIFRAAVRFAMHFVSGFTAVLALALIVPSFFGYGSLTVLSGSMMPTLHVGDVVIEHKVSPLSVRVGDIVTFRVPEHQSRLYTHRVVSMEADGADVSFVTKGDANTGVERWTVPTSGTIGCVELRIPYLGYLTNRAGSRIGRFGLLVIPAVLLALVELRRIWRRSDD
jgi:signal peptidase